MSENLEKKLAIRVATVGHVDHGKTTFAAAITKSLAEFGTKSVVYDQIDNAPEEKARGITINASTIEYTFKAKNGTLVTVHHVDCPGHQDFIKNAIVGMMTIDVGLVVVSAADGVMVQTKEHIRLLKQLGIEHILVVINKIDLLDNDADMIGIIRAEVLDECKSNGINVPEEHVLEISAFSALNDNDAKGNENRKRIRDFFVNIVGTLNFKNLAEMPFLAYIEKTSSVEGIGTIINANAVQGTLVVGIVPEAEKKLNPLLSRLPVTTELEILGFEKKFVVTIGSVEIFHKTISVVHNKTSFGLRVKAPKLGREDVQKGQVLAEMGKFKTYRYLKISAYMPRTSEGGKAGECKVGYEPVCFLSGGQVTGKILGFENGAQYMSGGDNTVIYLELRTDVCSLLSYPVLGREGNFNVFFGRIISCGEEEFPLDLKTKIKSSEKTKAGFTSVEAKAAPKVK